MLLLRLVDFFLVVIMHSRNINLQNTIFTAIVTFDVRYVRLKLGNFLLITSIWLLFNNRYLLKKMCAKKALKNDCVRLTHAYESLHKAKSLIK